MSSQCRVCGSGRWRGEDFLNTSLYDGLELLRVVSTCFDFVLGKQGKPVACRFQPGHVCFNDLSLRSDPVASDYADGWQKSPKP